METQSYARHTRMDPLYHYVGVPLALFAAVDGIVNLILHFSWITAVVAVGAIALLIAFIKIRRYATQLQDRIIRGEENFRHYLLTGAPLDSSLTTAQIIALRFASDAELPALAGRAVQERLTGDGIKRAVRQWRADTSRV